VRLEGLGKLKKIHPSGTLTRDVPACSTVPQPTTWFMTLHNLVDELSSSIFTADIGDKKFM
jgi:hypothetical protein